MLNSILIIDFGSQYTQLIARRVREINVFCEIYPFNKINLKLISKLKPKGIILSGGPNSVLDKKSPKINPEILNSNIPILGICYGLQSITKVKGGIIRKSISREYGSAKIKITKSSKILPTEWINKSIDVWMSHGDHVFKPPKEFKIIAKSHNGTISIISDENKNIFGLQFHPEVSHTYQGFKLIKNFVIKICKIRKNWILENFIENKIKEIRKIVGKKNVICGLSGGVDSTVTSYLLHRAIGKQLYCIFIDHGFLRKNETNEVHKYFK